MPDAERDAYLRWLRDRFPQHAYYEDARLLRTFGTYADCWAAGIAHERARAAEAQRLRDYQLVPWELERYDREVERLEGKHG